MNADVSKDRDRVLDELLQGPKYPDREFVRFGATFAEVYAMAGALHAKLLQQAKPGMLVCLATEDKAIVAAALLASLSGGPSLLLPYAFSTKVLAQMHRTTGFPVALADRTGDFPEGVKVIRPQAVGSAELTCASGHNAAEVELVQIFTGGTTGTPRIWSKTGRNLFGEGLFLAERFGVTTSDCILATIPPYHIYGLLYSIILPLVSGATVVDATPSFPEEIVRIAGDTGSTILASVPAHYRALRDREFPLRLAFSSAGMLDPADNAAFCRHNACGVVEVYGSTETGGIATRHRSRGEEFFTPFPTLDWRILNGCLAVRSPYISSSLPLDAEGFFTTGDRAEAMGQNEFALKGRADMVTKVGGKRVDLDEISLFLKKQSGVTDCVVLALPDSGGREHLIGALIQGENVDCDKIKRALAEVFEPYALPRRMKTVEWIPLTQNGKYDWQSIVRQLEK